LLYSRYVCRGMDMGIVQEEPLPINELGVSKPTQPKSGALKKSIFV